jgi:hypothetical protein
MILRFQLLRAYVLLFEEMLGSFGLKTTQDNASTPKDHLSVEGRRAAHRQACADRYTRRI